ncbi:glycoside hydrolase family 18 protein [Hyaloscypha variabilis F]|uniref:chitinase n=1 Tax=Hyaloscypha variabilis (strain UAMH 11265 / GT02V1 / F) TaxID=1149755 RepID=A0A2J6RXQ1_HYAVF|nr:glycoside hydrolase family 18 protein [Hyaloscypha variabilis F]
MYLTGQHQVIPEPGLVSEVTHVAIAFMPSSIFNKKGASEWPLFTTVEEVRSKFPEGTKIMVAIGGWGDTGFSKASSTVNTRRLFATNVKAMVDATGADGVDIDWEYPCGNGEDYKKPKSYSNVRKEFENYPKLLSEIRYALGRNAIISAAVPGLRRDMLAFTKKNLPKISRSLNFFNVMTYDLMNRRDDVTKHHSGVQLSIDAVNAYLERGVPPQGINLGFAFYVKWFRTDPNGGCEKNPLGCKTVLMEDPKTGADLGQCGAFAWNDRVPKELAFSFRLAQRDGKYDEVGGGFYYWDSEENIFWSWDTPEAIARKFPLIVKEKGLGGVFAWGLGEDGSEFNHFNALTDEVRDWKRVHPDPVFEEMPEPELPEPEEDSHDIKDEL